MTNAEKEYFCAWAASLLAAPEGTMTAELDQEAMRSLGEENVRQWGGDPRLLSEFFAGKKPEDLLPALQREYARLFTDGHGEKISLVESTYKPWTQDSGCALAFAGTKGLLMGDCALHMRQMFRELSLEVPEKFRSTPDHLVLELEFLSFLYHSAGPEQIQRFIEDHLNWIPNLRDQMGRAHPHPFYRNAIELIYLFLLHEKKEGKAKDHGPQNLH
ncbi:MAG: molecular chaperone TorD family protein [Deltaproteobacteria bacterium]|nr:molecular chaperone TorD family protein [Deltaproteobacteria bacterium]